MVVDGPSTTLASGRGGGGDDVSADKTVQNRPESRYPANADMIVFTGRFPAPE
jgi:hypothetical protein